MRYGYFDLENKEYVITNPATPAPWVNYLGDPQYGAIISNNAAGYSFVKSGANGRITRFRFNSDMALPGRYIYIRDRENADYWSASWQPVGKPLDEYQSECRHGTGYTSIRAKYTGISTCVTYFVPLGQTYEVWHLKIKNEDNRSRSLSVFGFVEFTNENNYEQDQVNLQYSLFISKTEFKKNMILQTICGNSEEDSVTRFFGLAGGIVSDACGSLKDFIGSYRTYTNPQVVEAGECGMKMNFNSNSCGSLQCEITLKPNETKELVYILGQHSEAEADRILEQYSSQDKEVNNPDQNEKIKTDSIQIKFKNKDEAENDSDQIENVKTDSILEKYRNQDKTENDSDQNENVKADSILEKNKNHDKTENDPDQKEEIKEDQISETHHISCKADEDITQLKNYWHRQLEHFRVETPSEEFNNMVNVWNAYQCFITFIWSRAASFIYCGLRNGYGYRDTVQDIQGIIHLNPEMALEKIRFMLSAQAANGAGLPLVKFHHKAGQENTPDDPEYVKETGHPSYRADDALWLFPTISKYIGETGNISFLKERILYADGGEDTVYGHLKQAIRFSMDHLGVHGMPAGLHADWNDCLRLGGKGESTFVAFQLYYAIQVIRGMAEYMNDTSYIYYLDEICKTLAVSLDGCWDEDRFIRGIREDGVVVGAKKDPEANMWLNPQSWSVISGFADEDKARKAMDSVYEILNTPYGAKLMEPPYKDHSFEGALMHIYNPDTKENGGIFSQSQGWLILAEALLGHGDRAFLYFMESSPAAMNDKAQIRVIEPYAHGQFTESTRSPFEGRSNVHWLTGTASTVMVGCVEGICGMRPDAGGLRISPSIPSSWDGFSISKCFRGKFLRIVVENAAHVQSGVWKIILNGKELPGDYIPAEELLDENDVQVILGNYKNTQ